MDFSLDESQRAVADLAAGVLRGDADDGRVLAALGSAGGYDEAAWKAMGQAGLLALGLPESVGGDAMGALAASLVLTEVGRQVLPLPALATLALGVGPIARYGTPEQHAQLLPEAADGRVLTAALRDAPGAGVQVAGGALSGTRVGVPYAEQAHRMLVPTAAGTAVVDPRADGVTLQRTETATRAPEYTVRLAGVAPESVIDATAEDVDRFAVAGAAAVADGVLAGALAADRRAPADPTAVRPPARHLPGRRPAGRRRLRRRPHGAPGRGVGSVAPRRGPSTPTRTSAWRRTGSPRELPAALQVCHHLHGGLGVDITYPLHRYYSHAKDLARFVGGAGYRLDRLAG